MENNYSEYTALKVLGSISISVAEITFSENDLITVHFHDDIILGVDDVKDLAIAVRELTGGEIPVRSLVITGQRNNISTEAFSYDPYLELKIRQQTIAEAVVIKNLATRIMANFYYKVTPRPFPVKVFESKDEAMNWLLSKEKN